MITAPVSLDEIGHADEADLYPQHVLAFGETALVLFAAGFWGRQDGYWIASAGMRATCVDTDADRLDDMAAVYPTDWDFVERDVYEWAPAKAVSRTRWDVVSVDCPSGHFDRCADLVGVWCALADRAVVLGCGLNREQIEPPEGWKLTEFRKRSTYDGGVYWAVLERA